MIEVYLTTPNGNGYTNKLVQFSVIKLLQDPRFKIRYDSPTHSPYTNNLHKCMNDFLDGGEDYWLTIDDDNPPLKNPLDLVEYDLDVIGFPTPVWANMKPGDRPWYFNALDKVVGGYKPHEPCEGLQEVDAVGSGCLLIARRVMDKLRWSHPFARQWNDDGTVNIGGDFSFCEKAKEAGFRVWTHYDYLCNHLNELPLLEVIRAFDLFYRSQPEWVEPGMSLQES